MVADFTLKVTLFGTSLHVSVDDEVQGRARIDALLQEHRIRPHSIEPIKASLEDLFIRLIERQSDETAEQTEPGRLPWGGTP